MAEQITVYLVVATSIGRGGPGALTEVGRFFATKDAENFRDALHTSWIRPHIVERKEARAAQHPAHGGSA